MHEARGGDDLIGGSLSKSKDLIERQISSVSGQV